MLHSDPDSVINIIVLFLDVDSQSAEDMSFKLLFSKFVIASALVAQSRSQENVEKQLQGYLQVRQYVAAFEKELPDRLELLQGKAREDLLDKLAMLFTFDFEAAIHLKTPDDLCRIVRKASQWGNIVAFQAMGDCLLRSNVGGQGNVNVYHSYPCPQVILTQPHASKSTLCHDESNYQRNPVVGKFYDRKVGGVYAVPISSNLTLER